MRDNRYNFISLFYDRLSLLLGKSYRESKYSFFDEICEGDKVLYLGGGTGENLSPILNRIGKNGQLVYMDASSRMIRKAKRRVPGSLKHQILFLHQSEFSKIPFEDFNLVLTQFFMDILPDSAIQVLFQEIDKRTDNHTKWIFVDFFEVKGKRWLLSLMVVFFRIFTQYPRKNLPDYFHYFEFYGWKISQKKLFKKGFIQAWLLKKEGEV